MERLSEPTDTRVTTLPLTSGTYARERVLAIKEIGLAQFVEWLWQIVRDESEKASVRYKSYRKLADVREQYRD
jgi:hypothetical protein